MRKIYFILISLLFIVGTTFAQKVNVDVKKTLNAPVIDGEIDPIWELVEPVAAEKPLFTEQPTVTVTWRAMWCDTAIFVLFDVQDDDHYTAEESGGNDWEFDKPEIYFDINDTLVEATDLGPMTASSGHWQVAPAFLAANEGIEKFFDNWNEHGADNYDSYVLTGSNYVREYRIPWKGMYDKNFDTLTVQKAVEAGMVIGFDICIIDQDQGITTARQRIVWQNDGNSGDKKESWESMDDCGTITLSATTITSVKDVNISSAVSVYPNPAYNTITVDANFDKAVFANLLGQEVMTMTQVRGRTLEIGTLPKGVYFIKVYKGEKFVGSAKFNKN